MSTEPNPLEEKVNKLEGALNEQNQKFDRLIEATAKLTIKPEPTFMPTEDNFGDLYATDPEKAIEEKIERKVNERVEAKAKEFTKNMTAREQTSFWDKKAEADFPDLNDQAGEFYKETQKEYKMLSSKDAPDAVYNAASRAYTNMSRVGKILPKSEMIRVANVHAGHVEGVRPGSPAPQKAELTEEQRYFCAKLGVKEDKFLARLQTKNLKT